VVELALLLLENGRKKEQSQLELLLLPACLPVQQGTSQQHLLLLLTLA
jgi:hypothetical protein